MQCPSCQFENMPGIEACGRCGAQLALASVSVDVHPPRSGRWEKRFRRWFSSFGAFDRSQIAVRDARAALEIELSPRQFLRMLVPGWPQMASGRARVGRIFFRGWLVLLVLGLLFVGTYPGGVFLGLALSLHASSVLDVVFAATPVAPLRAFYSVLGVVFAAVVVYLPPGWLITRVALPQRIVMTTPPFERGDVVLYNQWAYRSSAPQLGDVVLYEIPATQVQGQMQFGYPAVYNVAGRRIDRIVACAGQKLEYDGREFRVDGEPSPWLPLNPDRPPPGLSVTVPTGSCLILPTTNPQEFSAISAEDWLQMSVVPTRSVVGKVYLRHQPLWRLWRIR